MLSVSSELQFFQGLFLPGDLHCISKMKCVLASRSTYLNELLEVFFVDFSYFREIL